MKTVKPVVALVMTLAAVLVVAQPNGAQSKKNSRQAASRPHRHRALASFRSKSPQLIRTLRSQGLCFQCAGAGVTR